MNLEDQDKAARLAAYTAWLTDPIHMEYSKLQEAEQYYMIPPEIYTKRAFIQFRRYALRFIEENSQGCEDALIPYVAMTYYDRLGGEYVAVDDQIVLQHVVEDYSRNGHLFLLCCITISWKMRTKGFDLTNFLRNKNFNYTANEVLEMEFLICRRLKWRLRPLTPFCFIEFMLPVLGTERGKPSPRRPARLLITRIQQDVAFLEYGPSILAAAALLNVAKRMFSETRYQDFNFLILTSAFYNTATLINKCVNHLDRASIQIADAIPISTEGDDLPPQPVPSASQLDQRPGKQIPISPGEILPVSEIQAGEDGGSEIQLAEGGGSSSQVNQDLEWRMDFELGWIEAQEENELGSGSTLLGRCLESCCSYTPHCYIM